MNVKKSNSNKFYGLKFLLSLDGELSGVENRIQGILYREASHFH